MSKPTAKLYTGNDTYVYLLGLADADKVHSDEANPYVTTATVKVTLQDREGNNVAGAVNVTMTHLDKAITVEGVTFAAGNYRGIIPDTVSLVVGAEYNAVVTAVYGLSNARWDLRLVAEERI